MGGEVTWKEGRGSETGSEMLPPRHNMKTMGNDQLHWNVIYVEHASLLQAQLHVLIMNQCARTSAKGLHMGIQFRDLVEVVL